jgi:hypothetical protein
MSPEKLDLLQGTLDLMVLQTLTVMVTELLDALSR